MIVAGSENDAHNDSEGGELPQCRLGSDGHDAEQHHVQNIDYDVFCSGTAALPDGRALVVGGTSDYFPFTGDNRASIFDPATERFVQSQSMADGRWYATATTLGDGRIMAFSGIGVDGVRHNTVEIYDLRNAGAGWSDSSGGAVLRRRSIRAWCCCRTARSSTRARAGSAPGNAWIFDPAVGTWAVSAPTTRDRDNGSAVLLPLLPPSYTPKVMNFGGGNPLQPRRRSSTSPPPRRAGRRARTCRRAASR